MKLKKIASLMLAGVMAISMLAGCASGNSSSSSSSSQPETAVTTGLADGMNAARGAYSKTIISYTENAELKGFLETIAASEYKKASTFDNLGSYNNATGDKTSVAYNLQQKLVGPFTTGTIATTFTAAGNLKTVKVYTVGGNYDAKTAGYKVGTEVEKLVKDATKAPVTVNAGRGEIGAKVAYTADVAATKVTCPDDSTKSVWVVAVVYTQTATKTADAT